METYLQPINDGANSFYKKATIINTGSLEVLRSYSTDVASYNPNTNEMTIFGWYSTTTARHINEFLQQKGFKKMSKKEMMESINKPFRK